MPTVLITGASRGFGRALFDVYSRRGWITSPLVRDPNVALQLRASAGARCHPIVADVATEQVEPAIAGVLERNSEPLDVLINNAGSIKKLRGLANTFPEDLIDLFSVHCVGVLRCTKAALPFLAEAKRPVVVNISSRWGSIGRTASGITTGIYSYQIAKAAQNMLTACLDQELAETGVRVFALHPGRLMTTAAAPDADTDPRDAAEALANWIDQVDDDTVCGFHDLMGGGVIEW
jgi:NAD(P)-dependent dehydrogenase (short-subunit alcohol dehydrogenase family)